VPDALDRLAGNNGPKFPTLLAFAHAFEVVEADVVPGLRRMNVIRNRAAHSVEYEPTKDDLLSIVNAMPDHITASIRSYAAEHDRAPGDVSAIRRLALTTLSVVADIEARAERLRWELDNHGAVTLRAMLAAALHARGMKLEDAIRQVEAAVPVTELPEWLRGDEEFEPYETRVLRHLLGRGIPDTGPVRADGDGLPS
jgi:hypothetical protein